MTGHQTLARQRLGGYAPRAVFLVLHDTEPPKRGFMSADEINADTDLPELHIGPQDIPGTLDLRCVRGLQVHVTGSDGKRVMAVARHARTFEPSEILAVADGAIRRWRPKA